MPPPPPGSAAEHQPPPPSVSGPVVLVLDDDELVRRALERLLEHNGFAVLLADNTTRAYTVLINCRVDCVVADLRLDRRSIRDGLELLDDVAATYPHCGRVLYSGHTNELEPRVFADHSVVAKGWWPYQLVTAIAQEIERRRASAPPNPPT